MSGDLAGDAFSAISSVTKQWKSEKRKADRQDHIRSYSRFYIPSDRITVREVAFKIMEEAYNKASANGKYYANARQIFYAARPLILSKATNNELDSKYFTQKLLKDYLEEFTPGWKVVWDARGHFTEPHTQKSIGIGGIEVEKYIGQWHSHIEEHEKPDVGYNIQTCGPENRFGAVLFIEKEGFDEILADAGIGKKYDLAIMSTKGIPVKAACDLLFALPRNVRVFVLHDFDKSGFTIVRTLRKGTRMAEGRECVDLGFRIDDVRGLESEPVGGDGDARHYLKYKTDATEEEINFLITDQGYRRWIGKRVELNAMMSDEFIEWIEKKLQQHNVQKVIPDNEGLAAAYKRWVVAERIKKIVEEQTKEIEEVEIPKDLRIQVTKRLKKNPMMPWDLAITDVADDDPPPGKNLPSKPPARSAEDA